MEKELHVWLKNPNNGFFYASYLDTLEAISKNEKRIDTTQPHFLHFSYGYRLFVHTDSNDLDGHEITLGECEGTNREIRVAHNIEKMLIAGEFKWF